ncbi:MAG: YggS family pyridoxal phosphate-dependent enzyme [Archangium sp.]|nr:YggS family pyridoxal phosphate-dependent enzyme [Archangium sp.]
MIDAASFPATLAQLEARIAAACTKANRPRTSVQLLAVSKRQPVEAIRIAYANGLRAFGENYAQELRDKHVECADLQGLRWHAIGPVQTKNAKYIAKAAHVFHALEKLEVAQALADRREGTPLDCFVEVNVGGEASKAGLAPSAVEAFVAQVRALPQLRVVGLMTLPPPDGDPRPHFRALAALAKTLGLQELSMGTTGDFEAAIEEGATVVRVGTALFGERPKPAAAATAP